MKIRMLGTGYGECKIKKRSLKDFRRSGGVLVDERILLDAPIDIFNLADELGLSDLFDSVRDVVISHSHPSHFSPEAIMRLASKREISLYATGKVLDLVPDMPNIRKVKLSTSLPIEIGDYTLYSLPANHTSDIKGEMCLNFVLRGDKLLLYALDGGGVNFAAWKTLAELKLDAVIIDCALETSATSFASTYHNNLEAVKTLKDILIAGKISEPGVKFVLTHIPSDRKRPIHDELSEAARKYGMSVAYDGYFFSV